MKRFERALVPETDHCSLCKVSDLGKYLADLGAATIRIDDKAAFIDTFHEPIRQLVFQSGVQLDLVSESTRYHSVIYCACVWLFVHQVEGTNDDNVTYIEPHIGFQYSLAFRFFLRLRFFVLQQCLQQPDRSTTKVKKK